MRKDVDKLGKNELQELRLRIGQPPQLVFGSSATALSHKTTEADIRFVISTVSQYSPWAAATVARGFITANGGHRVGICGECVVQNGAITGIRTPTSLCIRVARDFPGLAADLSAISGSVLIVGPPGSGKTTLLRDLIRYRSNTQQGSVAVIDERSEIFPVINGYYSFNPGINTDVLTGGSKQQGIDMLLRTMGPRCIAVDEITSGADCEALEDAAWCGVRLLATAHARDKQDLYGRKTYQRLIAGGVFDTLLVLDRNKQWRTERMTP
jgi:stage III sporulation protein AA